VIGIFVIRRPAEKIAIVVVHRAVLPKLAAAVYSPQKKKEEENGKEEFSHRVRKSDLFL
jgi:DNA-binding IscR family transcriptional regulator